MTNLDHYNGSITVLCVDDDQEFVAMLQTFLEREAEILDITTATSATVGINRLKEKRIDCVVSDYDMPRTDGLEFLRTVRAMYPGLPFILFTGEGDEAVAGEALSAGATDYIMKESDAKQYEVLADRITAAVACQRAESTLQRAAEEQSTVIESINDAVYRTDAQGRFSSVNEAFVEMSGYSRSELVGAEVSLLKDDATIDRFEDAVREMLHGTIDEATITFEMQTADGERIQCEDSLSLLPLQNGEYSGVVGSIRDVSTDTRRTQDGQQKDKKLDEFTSIVSHDLRNPLSVARGRIALARQEYESEHLDDAELALERMETLIEDLLTLARQEVSPTEREPVSIRETAAAAERMIDADPGIVEAGASRLQELFENLLINAVQHTGPETNVHIGPLDDATGFYVADDGLGIPPEDREQVFERGFTTSSDGTGLGLAIVMRIAQAHDWKIILTESTTGGARFEVVTE